LLSSARFRRATILRRVILCGIAVLLPPLGGCKKRKSVASAQQEPGAAVPAKPASRATAPVQAPVPLGTDALYHQAEALSKTDIQKAMETLEQAIAKAPDDPHSAPYYFLLGKLKREYEKYQDYNADSPEQAEKLGKEFREYAEGRSAEYFHDESSDAYFYSGFHFRELDKRFPSNPLAVDAAYEITNLTQGGECEGQLVCYIDGGLAPVREFLLRYPDSPHTSEAVERADDAFRKNLWGPVWKTSWTEVRDPTKATDFYDPAELKKVVGDYEGLAEKLPDRFRPRVYETTAYYHARLGETDRARQLYTLILQQAPDYENIGEVRKALRDLH
jgi:tetratricopeptide (TPR) repeat protein